MERVLITDFGLARAVDDASFTRSCFIAGTPEYMAPEQANGEHVDHRIDLFSLGSVMYAMCTGQSPFRRETTMGVLAADLRRNDSIDSRNQSKNSFMAGTDHRPTACQKSGRSISIRRTNWPSCWATGWHTFEQPSVYRRPRDPTSKWNKFAVFFPASYINALGSGSRISSVDRRSDHNRSNPSHAFARARFKR